MTSNEPFISVNGLSKKYGSKTVLSDINFEIGSGEIVGLIGPNGAGKSTLLKAMMGLISYSGSLSVFGKNPISARTELLQNLSYIADVATLPGWIKVTDLLDYVEGVHPKFEKQRAVELLTDTPISLSQKVETLSKGMKTRLHLAVILAINTDLLILDEPTLGLDVLVRRDFQERLVNDYYNQQRSILITTHQIDEVESILTRVIFIREGQINVDLKVSELKEQYTKLLTADPEAVLATGRRPIAQRTLPHTTEMIFQGVDSGQLDSFGEIQVPSLEDLFVATNSQ